MIQTADSRLFLVVASAQRGIDARDRAFDRCPFSLTVLILGYTGLQTSLVRVRARVPHVLIAVCLGKEQAQADATCRFGVGGIQALGACNNGSQVDDVIEWRVRFLRIGGWR